MKTKDRPKKLAFDANIAGGWRHSFHAAMISREISDNKARMSMKIKLLSYDMLVSN